VPSLTSIQTSLTQYKLNICSCRARAFTRYIFTTTVNTTTQSLQSTIQTTLTTVWRKKFKGKSRINDVTSTFMTGVPHFDVSTFMTGVYRDRSHLVVCVVTGVCIEVCVCILPVWRLIQQQWWSTINIFFMHQLMTLSHFFYFYFLIFFIFYYFLFWVYFEC